MNLANAHAMYEESKILGNGAQALVVRQAA